jgi:hypothetical protein
LVGLCLVQKKNHIHRIWRKRTHLKYHNILK